MRVVFRADATQASGAGHVMRCWALAEEFSSRGWEVAWQAHVSIPWLAESFRRTDWSVQVPRGRPEDQASSVDADLVVVDSYALPISYRQTLLDRRVPVVVIADDHHATLGPGSLWVNPGVPVGRPAHEDFLNGPDFVLLRQEVRELRVLRSHEVATVDITFLLGGTDFGELAPVIDSLQLALEVCAGPGVSSNSRISWLPGGPSLIRQAAKSRLVISAAGVSSWEMLHIGVPLGLIATADNQQGNYRWMSERGWAHPLGSSRELADVEKLSTEIARIVEGLKDGEGGTSPALDGLGVKRVVDAALARL